MDIGRQQSDVGVGLVCPVCRYDLAGLGDGVCPECGTAYSLAELRRLSEIASRSRLTPHGLGEAGVVVIGVAFVAELFSSYFWAFPGVGVLLWPLLLASILLQARMIARRPQVLLIGATVANLPGLIVVMRGSQPSELFVVPVLFLLAAIVIALISARRAVIAYCCVLITVVTLAYGASTLQAGIAARASGAHWTHMRDFRPGQVHRQYPLHAEEAKWIGATLLMFDCAWLCACTPWLITRRKAIVTSWKRVSRPAAEAIGFPDPQRHHSA